MSAFRIILLLILISPSSVVAGLSVFVSVLPQKMMVERVGGAHVEVSVMVGKGFNPATYQPTPRQIAMLANADNYLRTGVPFEDSWLPRFQSVNPRMRVLDLRDGIELLPVFKHAHGEPREALDPHIWTDPLLLDHQAALVRDLLQQQMPEYADEFAANYRRLSQQLHDLDQEIRHMLDAVDQRRFLVFHPAWGYFAHRYGWQQVAAEHDGKEPNARDLALLIEQAIQQGIHKVIIQPQNNSKTARTLAEAIRGKLVVADPLAEDYFSGLRDFARLLGDSNG
jgi:zinc transport system substrate-binding protein